MANASWDAIKLGSKLAFQSRQAIQKGGFSPWILPLSMAGAKDALFDPLTIIPIAGLIPMTFSLCITVYLLIFLWGKGKWKVRIAIFFLELVDIIPVVGMIPLSVAAVLYAWSQNKKLIDQAKQQLPVLEQTNAQMIYAYQRDQSLRTMQEEATQAEQQAAAEEQEAIGDVQSGDQGSGLSMRPQAQGGVPHLMGDVKVPQNTVVPQAQEFRESAGSDVPNQRMMDGAQGRLAHMRGRAANDSEYKERQPMQQRAVSGSDIAPVYHAAPVGTHSSEASDGLSRVAAAPAASTGHGSAPSFQTPPPPSGSGMVPPPLPPLTPPPLPRRTGTVSPSPLSQTSGVWDPNGSIPPPLPSLMVPPPLPAWSPTSGTPPPMTPEYGVNEPMWPGKERGLPPPLPSLTPPPLPISSGSGMVPPPLPPLTPPPLPSMSGMIPPPLPVPSGFQSVLPPDPKEVEAVIKEGNVPQGGQETIIGGVEILTVKEREIASLLEKNMDGKYEKIITEIRKEKIDWVQSSEFARRIQLTGASSEDVQQIREWVLGNLANGKVHVFEKSDITALKERLVEYSKLESGSDETRFEQGRAFYVNGNSKHLPESVLNNVHVPESKFEPNAYPADPSTEALLNHEIGHQAQDGLLESELYKDWKPTIKAGAPDPEYIGNIVETDTRVRAMFRELKGVYDPEAGAFGETELAHIHEKQKQGLLGKDTMDLLEHYDDVELIRIANFLPAI